MIDFIIKSIALAFAIVTGIFTFVPETFFGKREWITQEALEQCKWSARLDSQEVNFSSCVPLAYMDCNIGSICDLLEIAQKNYD